jgi:hypothetical protein
MRKIYVVQARSYEYNDETYDRSDGGNVVHAYSSEDAANAALLEKTMESFRTGGMCYLAEAYNVFDDEALDILEKHNLAPKSDYLGYYEAEDITDAIKSGKITEDELRILALEIKPGLELFFIEEVEVD